MGASHFSGPVISANGFQTGGPVVHAGYVANTATSATTLTALSVAGAADQNCTLAVVNMTGTLAAGANVTLPLVTDLATIQSFGNTDSYVLRVINSSSGAFSWTVTTNTGWTLNGTMTVAQNTWRDFVVTFTSATTASLTTIGIGTYS